MRGRFVRRIAALFVALFVLALAGVGLLAWLGISAMRGEAPGAATGAATLSALILMVLLGVLTVGRAIRRTAHPAADLVEAAGALAEGDFDVAVEERGAPEMRRLARSFNRMAERLRAQDRERRDLLADVTHELRTPLTVIQGNLEGLLDGVYPPDEAHLRPVLEETRVLSALIEDLRTLTLAEAGALPLHREAVDLDALIRDAVAAHGPQAEAAGVGMTADVASDVPPLEADPLRVRQVLGILLTNALQHTPRDGRVSVRCALAAEDPAMVNVSVSDTGTGISGEHLPRVFERFYKSKGSKGSGLGLPIARNLVLLHGGHIVAESTLGAGTTVRFTLPARPH
jgi:signal transduction histidine kinase